MTSVRSDMFTVLSFIYVCRKGDDHGIDNWLQVMCDNNSIDVNDWTVRDIYKQDFLSPGEPLELHISIAYYNNMKNYSGYSNYVSRLNRWTISEGLEPLYIAKAVKVINNNIYRTYAGDTRILNDIAQTIKPSQSKIPVLKVSFDKKDIDNFNNYGRGSTLFHLQIFDNAKDAFNDNSKAFYRLYDLFTTDYNLAVCGAPISFKVRAGYIGDTLIITDNLNGYKSIKNQLEASHNLLQQINCLVINQYHLNFRTVINAVDPHSTSYSVMTLSLFNQSKITQLETNNFGMRPETVLYCIFTYNTGDRYNPWVRPKIKIKMREGRLVLNSDVCLFPVVFDKEKNIHNLSIEYLNELVNPRITTEEFIEIGNKYVSRCLYNTEPNDNDNNENDILMQWFGSCVTDAKKEKNNLKKAYESLRNNLLKEYEDVKTYLDYYNLSKVKPIPSITLKKGLNPNCITYTTKIKTVHVINNRELTKDAKDTINQICYSFILPGQKYPIYAKTDMAKVLDTKNNILTIDRDVLIKDYTDKIEGRVGY